ncbi:hypothetical protein K438DRAFT_2150852 [Mycena galopus ATCC 62051]|nr:hypothetical protein K438DRAFT_2150852 [Mycena galopus ATCC 62051]
MLCSGNRTCLIEDDDMDVDVEVIPTAKKPAPKKNPKTAVPKKKAAVPSKAVVAKRKYVADAIASSEDELPLPPKTLKSNTTKKSNVPASIDDEPPAPKSKPKLTKTTVVDDDGDDEVRTGSDSDKRVESDHVHSQSEPDSGDADIGLESAHFATKSTRKSAILEPTALFGPDEELPKPTRRRRTSLSSMGSMPPDTDFDFEENQDSEKQEDNWEDDEIDAVRFSYAFALLSITDPNTLEQTTEPKKLTTGQVKYEEGGPRRLSAQQLKYNEEKPVIRSSKVMHVSKGKKAEVAPSDESAWDSTARLVFPLTGGQIKLLAQGDTIKEITRSAINLHLYEIGFKAGYESTVSRPAVVRKLMRLSAKKHPRGSHVAFRAKEDLVFCGHLASIELNKPGITPTQVCAIVKQLIADQRYIFPYASPRVSDDDANTNAADGASDIVTVKDAHKGVKKNFATTLPFHAPIFVEVIHEIWWINSKALGFKHVKDLNSNRIDRPAEVVLPDPMICLVGTHIQLSATDSRK